VPTSGPVGEWTGVAATIQDPVFSMTGWAWAIVRAWGASALSASCFQLPGGMP
jgi:hypothetical protein